MTNEFNHSEVFNYSNVVDYAEGGEAQNAGRQAIQWQHQQASQYTPDNR